MARTPLFGAGSQGRSPVISAQRRVNCYVEVQPIEDGTKIAFIGTAGKEEAFIDLGAGPPRGGIVVNDYLYVVHNEHLWRIDNGGNQTLIGDLNTDAGRVSMAAGVSQVLIVDGTNGYVLTPATDVLAQIIDPDFPNGAKSSAWDGGYFIVDDPEFNLFAISAQDDAMAWDALEAAAAEANPDAIARVMTSYGYVQLLGLLTTELWSNVGSSIDFPYRRVTGGVIPRGLAARWSATEFRDGIAGLFQQKEGGMEVGVLTAAGYAKISTPEVDYQINRYTNKANATGLSYRYAAHSFYQINFAEASWLFDADSNLWSELQDVSGGRDRAEQAWNFIDRIVVADYENGKLYRLNPEIFTEEGERMIWTLRSRHLFDQKRRPITALQIDMETGVTGVSEDPQAVLKVSRDKGRSWGTQLRASTGKIGEYEKRVTFRRLGAAYNFTFEVSGQNSLPPKIIGEAYVQ